MLFVNRPYLRNDIVSCARAYYHISDRHCTQIELVGTTLSLRVHVEIGSGDKSEGPSLDLRPTTRTPHRTVALFHDSRIRANIRARPA